MSAILDLLESILPFIDFGRIKITTKLDYLQFFKPIAGKEHWEEENYDKSPIRYRMKCKVILFNGKKKVRGINSLSFKLKYKNALVDNEIIEGNYDIASNIPSGERREIEITQQGELFFSENLKNGYTLVFKYHKDGSEKEKEKVVKRVKLPTINIR